MHRGGPNFNYLNNNLAEETQRKQVETWTCLTTFGSPDASSNSQVLKYDLNYIKVKDANVCLKSAIGLYCLCYQLFELFYQEEIRCMGEEGGHMNEHRQTHTWAHRNADMYWLLCFYIKQILQCQSS